MKKIILLMVSVVLVAFVGTAQTISTFPYNEDFESMALGTVLSNGWDNPTTDDLDWTVDVNGTTSSPTGPTANGGADHKPGVSGGKYVYVETSGTVANGTNIANLVSPYFDFTTVTRAKLEFWYHAFGATIGTLNVEVKVGSQGTWTNIGGPITDDLDAWQKGEINICSSVLGLDSVQFQFSYQVGTSYTGDMALDDISVFETGSIIDIGVTSVAAQGGCGLTANEVLDFTICNFGDSLIPGTVIPVSFTINGGVAVVENFTLLNGLGDACGNGCIDFTTTSTFDLSTPGSYVVVGRAMYTPDAVITNDAAVAHISNTIYGGSVPYFEDFEGGQNGFTIDNTINGTWALGTPAGSVINAAASGNNAFVTNLTGDYDLNENSSVTSSCIDISNASGFEVLTMKVWWDTQNSWGGANLFGSYDGGATWDQIGNDGDPNNWYNDNTINGQPNGVQEGWTGTGITGSPGWVAVQHVLDTAMMQSNNSLMLRIGFGSATIGGGNGFAFDDVAIGFPNAMYEYGVAGIDSVMGICDASYTLDAGAGHSFYHWADVNNHNYNGTWSNTQTVEVTETGTYVITVANAAGMLATDTVFVEMLDFTPPVLADVISCLPGDSAEFDAGSGTTPVNILYNWSTGDATQTSWLYALGTITVTKTDTALGCFASDTAIFTDTPLLNLGNDTAICEGSVLMLNAGPLYNYLWSDSSTNQSLVVDSAALYYVTISDFNNCTASDSINISINPLPTVDLGNDTLLCFANNPTLDAGTASSYLWNNGATSQTIVPATSGDYSVIITDANGCTDTDTVFVVMSACVGIDELSNETAVKLYPNPTKGELTVQLNEFDAATIVSVMTVYGQVVRSERITANTTTLHLDDLAEGTYLLQIKSQNAISVNKFIINR